jgi:hypothetical protein
MVDGRRRILFWKKGRGNIGTYNNSEALISLTLMDVICIGLLILMVVQMV